MKHFFFFLAALLLVVQNVNAQSYIFGADTGMYPTTVMVPAHHKDVMAQLFIAPANGTLDTLFFKMGNVGALDNKVIVRIFKTAVNPEVINDWLAHAVNWGYYHNTNDADQGIAAFLDEATDTTWHSTIDGSTPSFYHLGDEMWGSGGFVKTVTPNAVNKIALADYGIPPTVKVGDFIFVTIKVHGPAGHVDDTETEFPTSEYGFYDDTTAGRSTLGVFGKFYEHEEKSIIANPPGPPVHGWRIISRSASDSLVADAVSLNIWFSMTPTSNTPPRITNMTRLNWTMDTTPQIVQATITDDVAVTSAHLKVWIERGGITIFHSSIPMSPIGGNVWKGTIPGQSQGSTVYYAVVADNDMLDLKSTDIHDLVKGIFTDESGATSVTPAHMFQVVSLCNNYYWADTGVTVTVPGGLTDIPQSSFFSPRGYEKEGDSLDCGTAGPFYISGGFPFFEDTMYYAWIGVNGAIGLSHSSSDSISVQLGGDHYHPAITGLSGNYHFVAPLYSDLILDAGSKISYETNYNGKFVVRWDSMKVKGTSNRVSLGALLDRNTGTIEYVYYWYWDWGRVDGFVGIVSKIGGIDMHSLICNDGYPEQLRPGNIHTIKFTPTQTMQISVAGGWNMMSVPMYVSDYTKNALFPTATSDAFIYDDGYVQRNGLTFLKGFWLKFNQDQVFFIVGDSITTDSITVVSGWNMIGTISQPFPVFGIVTDPPDMETSEFFGYNGIQYVTTTTLMPGDGYWVRVSKDGKLILDATLSASTTANRIKIVPTSEMPPPPPVEIGNTILLPKEYCLEYNYPNPFNPVTTLKYGLPLASNVKLKIYNTLGQIVVILVDEIQEAGYKSVNWNSSNIASGVYFYRLEATSLSNPSKMFTQVRKMIFLK